MISGCLSRLFRWCLINIEQHRMEMAEERNLPTRDHIYKGRFFAKTECFKLLNQMIILRDAQAAI